MKNILLSLSLIGVFFASSAFAGPFGTHMGQDFKEINKKYGLKKLLQDEPIYLTNNIFKKHKDFSSYILIFSDNKLCKIVGQSNFFKNDSYGSSAKILYYNLKDSLIEKYGEPNSITERSKPDGIYKKQNEFVKSVYYNETEYSCFWNIYHEEISTILLDIKAYDSNTLYITLAYEYNNMDEFANKRKAKNDDSL